MDGLDAPRPLLTTALVDSTLLTSDLIADAKLSEGLQELFAKLFEAGVARRGSR